MDRRVKRTRKRLREALIELLHKKEVSEITVSELAEKADINRGTFYTHYRHAADLMTSLVDEFLEDVEKCFQRGGSREMLESLYEAVDQNSDLLEVLMNDSYFKHFYKDLKDKICKGCRSNWHIDERNQKHVIDYAYSYIAGGICNLIIDWISEERSRSAIEMAIITEIFITSNIKNLQ